MTAMMIVRIGLTMFKFILTSSFCLVLFSPAPAFAQYDNLVQALRKLRCYQIRIERRSDGHISVHATCPYDAKPYESGGSQGGSQGGGGSGGGNGSGGGDGSGGGSRGGGDDNGHGNDPGGYDPSNPGNSGGRGGGGNGAGAGSFLGIPPPRRDLIWGIRVLL